MVWRAAAFEEVAVGLKGVADDGSEEAHSGDPLDIRVGEHPEVGDELAEEGIRGLRLPAGDCRGRRLVLELDLVAGLAGRAEHRAQEQAIAVLGEPMIA